MIILTLVTGELIGVDKSKIVSMSEVYKGSRFLYTEVRFRDSSLKNVLEDIATIKERMEGGN